MSTYFFYFFMSTCRGYGVCRRHVDINACRRQPQWKVSITRNDYGKRSVNSLKGWSGQQKRVYDSPILCLRKSLHSGRSVSHVMTTKHAGPPSANRVPIFFRDGLVGSSFPPAHSMMSFIMEGMGFTPEVMQKFMFCGEERIVPNNAVSGW